MSKKLRLTHVYKAALLVTTGLVMIGCSSTGEQSAQMGDATNASFEVPVDKTQKANADWERVMRVADRAWSRGDHKTAFRLYRGANQARPSDLRPLMSMGEILRKTGRGNMAISLYNAALQLSPDYAEIHNGLGYSLLSLDKPFLATKSFQKALDLNVDSTKALGGMAVALDTAGEHERAHVYYRQAIENDPENLTYQSNLGLSLALSGHTDEAIALLERVSALPNATAKHRQNLALVYGLAGKRQEAMRYSRMDLNESDSKNNQLYFQALNGTDKHEDVAQVTTAQPKPKRQVARAITKQPKRQALQTAAKQSNQQAPFQTLGTGRREATTLTAALQTTSLKTNRETVETGVPQQLIPARSEAQEYHAALPDGMDILLPDMSVENTADQSVPRTAAKAPNVAVASLTVRQEFLQAPFQTQLLIPRSQNVSSSLLYDDLSVRAEDLPPQVHLASLHRDGMVQPKISQTSQDKAYFVQMGSYKSAQQAMAGWQVLKARHQYLLTDYNPVIAEADLGEDNGGLYYRLRIGGFAKKAISMSLCSDLKNQRTDCFTPYVIGFEGPILDQSATVASAPNRQPHQGEAAADIPGAELSALADSATTIMKDDGFIAHH